MGSLLVTVGGDLSGRGECREECSSWTWPSVPAESGGSKTVNRWLMIDSPGRLPKPQSQRVAGMKSSIFRELLFVTVEGAADLAGEREAGE